LSLEDLQPDATVRGILPDALVTVVSVAWHGSDTVTVTTNEILTSLNKPDDFIRRPFRREPDFGVTGVNDDFAELLARAEEPR